MVHLATLVHDDVMDVAETGRQPTLAANWGNEVSIPVGDCLFAQAVKLAASFPSGSVPSGSLRHKPGLFGRDFANTPPAKFRLNRAEFPNS
jgi:hypothetical protein